MSGSLEATMERLVELEATIHPTLEVYKWWQGDMKLPAVWNWLTPGDVEKPPVAAPGATCRVRNLARISVVIGVDPTAVVAGDMLEVAAYFDLAFPILAGELYGRAPLGNREARMRGAQAVSDQLGDASILTLELPLEVYLDFNVQTRP